MLYPDGPSDPITDNAPFIVAVLLALLGVIGLLRQVWPNTYRPEENEDA